MANISPLPNGFIFGRTQPKGRPRSTARLVVDAPKSAGTNIAADLRAPPAPSAPPQRLFKQKVDAAKAEIDKRWDRGTILPLERN